ncbi:MAG: type II secretion system protein GspG [bacterium]
MKFRCPHCKQILEKLDHGLCTSCRKAIRLPEPPPKEEYVPRGRRAPSLRIQGGSIPFISLFSGRPGFALWVLGISVIVGVSLFAFKYDEATPRRIATREDRTSDELGRLHTALQWFRQTSSRYPTAEEGLDILAQSRAPGWVAPYVSDVPYDLWGTPFQYSCSNDVVKLFSCGADKVAGTADDVASPGPDYKGVVQRLAMTTNSAD